MSIRNFLYEVLEDLRSIASLDRISKERLLLVNQLIWEFKDNYDKQPRDDYPSKEYDEDYYSSNEDSLYNREDFNHDMDIDQQGPDFDF